MFKIALRVLLVSCVVLAAQYVQARATTEKLVSDCRQEAMTGHFRAGRGLPVEGPEILNHRKRMLAVCTRWLTVKREDASRLLPQCLTEAALGLHVEEHGIDVDHSHVARQQRICRELAEAAND